MSKSVEQIAQKYLKDYKQDKIHATSDGYLFHHKPDAIAHGKKLKEKAVQTFTRNDKAAAKETAKASFTDQKVTEIAKALPGIKDVKVLEGYLAEENAKEEPRTTAVAAIEERIAELTK